MYGWLKIIVVGLCYLLFAQRVLAQPVRSPLESYVLTSQVCDFMGECAMSGLHTAVDLVGSEGTAVLSPADGVVVHTRIRNRYGNVVMVESVIDGETVVFLMAHMRSSDLQVRVGDTVQAGQWLGSLGNSDEIGGWVPHLHFGVRKGPFYDGSSCSGNWTYSGYEFPCAYDDWYHPTQFIEAHQYPTNAQSRITAKVAELTPYGLVSSQQEGLHWFRHDTSTYVQENWTGSVFSDTAIGYNAGDDKAYVIRNGFWQTVSILAGQDVTIGVPLGDEMDLDHDYHTVYDNAGCHLNMENCIQAYCGGDGDEFSAMQRFSNSTLCWHRDTWQSCVSSGNDAGASYLPTCTSLQHYASSGGDSGFLGVRIEVEQPDACAATPPNSLERWVCDLNVGAVNSELFTNPDMDEWPTSPSSYDGFTAKLTEGTTFSHNRYGINDLTVHANTDWVKFELELDKWTQDLAFDLTADPGAEVMVCGFEYLHEADTVVNCQMKDPGFVEVYFPKPVNYLLVRVKFTQLATLQAVYLPQDNDGDGYSEPNADRDDADAQQRRHSEVTLNQWAQANTGHTAYVKEHFNSGAMASWPSSPTQFKGFKAYLIGGTTFSHQRYGRVSDLTVHGDSGVNMGLRRVRAMLDARTKHLALEVGGSDVQVCSFTKQDALIQCWTYANPTTAELQMLATNQTMAYIQVSSHTSNLYLDAIYTLPDSDNDGKADDID